MAEAKPKKISLRSSDNEVFEVEEEVAMMSETIKNMMEDLNDEETGETCDQVPIHNVRGTILSKVIEYCRFHVEAEKKDENDKSAKSEDDIKQWDTEYMKIDQNVLYELILAANYLNIKNLLDLCCLTVANMIKGKSPEEIRRTFNIKNDFTPEEEEEVRRENQWAFD